MDINKIIERVKNVLTTPKTEWPVIAAEPATASGLYKNYIVILAAIPAIVGFIKSSLIGHSILGITVRSSIGSGLAGAVVGYALSLALIYVMALIIEALAPTFGGEKNRLQALKTAAYAWTASWLANVGLLIPWLGALIVLVGIGYSIYLLYLALPVTMKSPPEKAAGYTALSMLCAIVLGWIMTVAVAGITGTGMLMTGGAPHSTTSSNTTIDKDSWLGKMEEASKKMEAAQKSGDTAAQQKAASEMMGAALGGGDKVEALAPDQLKPFVPETLAGLKRTSVSAERNGAMGMQTSEARATYSDDGSGRSLHLSITDMGSMKGLVGLAGWAGVENSKETSDGYEKTYKQSGRLVHEQWDKPTKSGEFGIVLGERFSVKVSGDANSIDELKTAVTSLDLAGLEALKNQGVKKN
ncbi:MAG: YIP1 family protein [Betaproteobacteria bacterium]|nr:YIP1 family protein [Betaproteobacteria bacterium]